jgi:hypothetical protein
VLRGSAVTVLAVLPWVESAMACPAAMDVRYVRRAFEEAGDLLFDTISVNPRWKP